MLRLAVPRIATVPQCFYRYKDVYDKVFVAIPLIELIRETRKQLKRTSHSTKIDKPPFFFDSVVTKQALMG